MADLCYIRRISGDSIDEIAELWFELKNHHQSKTTHFSDYYANTNFEHRKAVLQSKERLAIFIAESKSLAVGFCVASVNGNIGEIDSLYAKPEFRHQHLGSRLMQHGLEWLQQHQPKHIRLMVGQGNEEVLAFYEKFGFKQRAIQMEKL